MARSRSRRKREWRPHVPGTSPGTIIVDPSSPKPRLRVIAYSPQEVSETEVEDVQQLCSFLDEWPISWVNVDGLGDAEILRSVAANFGLHRLALEDVVHTHQRPKVEHYGDHLFIVLRMPLMADRLETEQVSMFLGKNFVLTFQEGLPGDCFDPVRERIRKGVGRIRGAGPDYLAYALVDSIIDSFFPVLEMYGEHLESLEDELIHAPDEEKIGSIHDVKRDLLTMRRAIWPLRDAIAGLFREPSHLITTDTHPYLRDCYDHAVQIIDLVETYRELGSGLMDVYLSSVSNRMNEVMKVLTIISTIFIPLSFIAGVYGMNFKTEVSPMNMPELGWYWGYPFSLTLMALVAAVLVYYFYQKGWLRRSTPRRPRPPAAT